MMQPLHTYVIGLLWTVSLIAPGAGQAGERYVLRDALGNRQFVLEQGMSGRYSLRDAKGQRIGSGYERMDGSIGLFDTKQRRIGTLSGVKR
jgi:hypothetical protein